MVTNIKKNIGIVCCEDFLKSDFMEELSLYESMGTLCFLLRELFNYEEP